MGVAPASFTLRAMERARARTRRTICASMACALGEACRGAPSVRPRNQRSVSGPAIWTFAKGSLRCSTSQRNGRSACHDVAVGTKESRPCPFSRVRSRRASKMGAPRIHSEASRNADPSGSVRRPGRPSSACGTMYSAGSRRGSWGAAGMSRRSACCSASASWVWGRLPMLLVASEGRAAGTGASYPFAARFGGIKRARVAQEDCSSSAFFTRSVSLRIGSIARSLGLAAASLDRMTSSNVATQAVCRPTSMRTARDFKLSKVRPPAIRPSRMSMGISVPRMRNVLVSSDTGAGAAPPRWRLSSSSFRRFSSVSRISRSISRVRTGASCMIAAVAPTMMASRWTRSRASRRPCRKRSSGDTPAALRQRPHEVAPALRSRTQDALDDQKQIARIDVGEPGGNAIARLHDPLRELVGTLLIHGWTITHFSRHAEIGRRRVVEDDGGDARLGVHHAAVGQLHADVGRVEDAEEDLLIVEARAGRIAEGVALPVVVRLEAVEHRRVERVREAPLAAERGVEQLRVRLGALQRERLQKVRFQEVAVLLRLLGAGADPFAGGGDEQTDAVVGGDVVGEAEAVLALLAGEGEAVELRAVRTEEHEIVPFAAGAEELVHRARFHRALAAFLLEIVEPLLEEERLAPRLGTFELGAVALLYLAHNRRLQAHVAPVDHHRIDEAPDLVERRVGDDVPLQVGRRGRIGNQRHLARAPRGGRPRSGPGGFDDRELGAAGGELALDLEALLRVHHALRQFQAAHRVMGIRDRAAVRRSDVAIDEVPRQGRAADEERQVDSGGAQVGGGRDHLLSALHQKAAQTEDVRLVIPHRLDERLGRNLDAEVHDVESVVREDDVDEVLADVVDVALHRREQHLAAARAVRPIHVWLEEGNGGLHRLGALQDFGDDELVVVEEAPDLVHPAHQGPVDDLEGRRALRELLGQVGREAVARAFHDVTRESLVERKLAAGGPLGLLLPEMAGEGLDRALQGRGVAAVQHRLGKRALVLRDRWVALQLLGSDDGEVETGLVAVVE